MKSFKDIMSSVKSVFKSQTKEIIYTSWQLEILRFFAENEITDKKLKILLDKLFAKMEAGGFNDNEPKQLSVDKTDYEWLNYLIEFNIMNTPEAETKYWDFPKIIGKEPLRNPNAKVNKGPVGPRPVQRPMRPTPQKPTVPNAGKPTGPTPQKPVSPDAMSPSATVSQDPSSVNSTNSVEPAINSESV